MKTKESQRKGPPFYFDEFGRLVRMYPTRDLDEQLVARMSIPGKEDYSTRTLFGEASAGLTYDHSDRLQQWDHEKYQKAIEHPPSRPGCARFYQDMLRFYHDDPGLELKHVIEEYNVSNGYPYLVFGYKPGNNSEA